MTNLIFAEQIVDRLQRSVGYEFIQDNADYQLFVNIIEDELNARQLYDIPNSECENKV
jgi:hypothetical protein